MSLHSGLTPLQNINRDKVRPLCSARAVAIAARDGQAREAGANEKRGREFNDESKQSLVAVQSILDSHAALVANLVEFREAVKALLDRVSDEKLSAPER